MLSTQPSPQSLLSSQSLPCPPFSSSIVKSWCLSSSETVKSTPQWPHPPGLCLAWSPPALTCQWGLTASGLPAHTLPPTPGQGFVVNGVRLHSCPCHTDPTTRQLSKRPLVFITILAPGTSPPRTEHIQMNALSTARCVTRGAGAGAARGPRGPAGPRGPLKSDHRHRTGATTRREEGSQSAQPHVKEK